MPVGPREATYRVEQDVVTLVGGRSENEPQPGVSGMIVTSVIGEPLSGDLNGDGVEDAGVWLLRQGGGTGSFMIKYLKVSRGALVAIQ